MAHDADVIVVGSGAGGATFAYACAQAGKRVLLLERGQRAPSPPQVHDERDTLIDKQPYDDRRIVCLLRSTFPAACVVRLALATFVRQALASPPLTCSNRKSGARFT
jgi:choline dehydrogenase-like flavoprotein